MPGKSKKKTFNFHLRKKHFSQVDEENPSEQDTGPAISEPIASRQHARSAKVRCIKSLAKIIKNERRLSFIEKSRKRVANESEKKRKQRLEYMRRLASKRLAAESYEQRQQRLYEQRRRAAQRVERERRKKEQKRRRALILSYLPTNKCAVSQDVPNVVLEPINLYNIVSVNTSQQQQQSESTNSSNNECGSQDQQTALVDDCEDDDDYEEYKFNIDIKVEPELDDQWELDSRGGGDLHCTAGHRDWNQSDEMSNNEADSNRRGDESSTVEPETDDIDIKEEPLDDEFHNVVLERTVLMMCQGD